MVVLRPTLPRAEPALLQHRDVADAVLLGEIVGRRQPVPAAADDHHVVGGLRLGVAPRRLPARLPRSAWPIARRRSSASVSDLVIPGLSRDPAIASAELRHMDPGDKRRDDTQQSSVVSRSHSVRWPAYSFHSACLQLQVGGDRRPRRRRLLQHARAVERAQRIEQVERQPLGVLHRMALGVHVDVEALAGIAPVPDAVEAGGQERGLQQVGVGGTVGEAQLEAAGVGDADHVRAVVAAIGDGVGRPGGARERCAAH